MHRINLQAVRARVERLAAGEQFSRRRPTLEELVVASNGGPVDEQLDWEYWERLVRRTIEGGPASGTGAVHDAG
jgi:hypothetical protein